MSFKYIIIWKLFIGLVRLRKKADFKNGKIQLIIAYTCIG